MEVVLTSDRTFLLSHQFWLLTIYAAVALCIVFPVFGLALWTLGFALEILAFISSIVLWLTVITGCISGLLIVFAGVFVLIDEKTYKEWRVSVAGILVFAICYWGTGFLGGIYAGLMQIGLACFNWGVLCSGKVFDVWWNDGLCVYSLFVPVGVSAFLSSGTLLLIPCLQWWEKRRRKTGRIRFMCMTCGESKVGYRCACGAVVNDLQPSVRGIFTVTCHECGDILSTIDPRGRSDLHCFCKNCGHTFDHPDQGKLPEYHVHLWGKPFNELTNWLTQSQDALLDWGRNNGVTITGTPTSNESQECNLRKGSPSKLPQLVRQYSFRTNSGRGALIYWHAMSHSGGMDLRFPVDGLILFAYPNMGEEDLSAISAASKVLNSVERASHCVEQIPTAILLMDESKDQHESSFRSSGIQESLQSITSCTYSESERTRGIAIRRELPRFLKQIETQYPRYRYFNGAQLSVQMAVKPVAWLIYALIEK